MSANTPDGTSNFTVVGHDASAVALWSVNPITQRVEAAIKTAAKLGPDAFDHHEGVGLYHDRLEIAALIEAATVGANRYRVLAHAMRMAWPTKGVPEELRGILADETETEWTDTDVPLATLCDMLRANKEAT